MDFNLHIRDDSNAVSDFNNSIIALWLMQHMDFPTHVHGHSLDLVIIEVANVLDLLSCEPGQFVSDHCVVIVIKGKKENIVSKSISFWNFKDMDDIDFANCA